MNKIETNNIHKTETTQNGAQNHNHSAIDGQNDKKADCNTNSSGHNKNYHWYDKITAPRITAMCTFAIVFITAFYTHYAGKQAVQMEKAVNVASDTEIRQLRAYINISTVTIINVAKPLPFEKSKNYKPTGAEITERRKGPIIDIQIINSGQTPAYKLECWATPKTLEYPLKSTLPGKSTKQVKQFSIITRDAPLHYDIVMEDPLTDSEKADLRKGSKAIYINGEITYTDIFKKEIRHTKFTLAHNGPLSGSIGISKAFAMLDEDAD